MRVERRNIQEGIKVKKVGRQRRFENCKRLIAYGN